MDELLKQLGESQQLFQSGITRRYEWRMAALEKLKTSLLNHEEEIYQALYTDLKKGREEVWVTETGFTLTAINDALRKLKSWMKPRKAGTNLLNQPSSSRVYKEPLGTVLIIAPWNYPLQLLLVPLVGALAAGNTVVVKPSEFAPATEGVLQSIISAAFDPTEVLFVKGDGATVIPHLMDRFRFDHIFYTGSTAVGRIIYQAAARDLIPVTLELGGKSPCVIEADANIAVAAKRIMMTKFSNAGQMCVAPDYILIHASQKEKFISEAKKALTVFFGPDPSTSGEYGKIINAKQFDRLTGYLSQAKVVAGGGSDRNSLFFEPTLVDNVSNDSPLMKEEIFGPILPIITFTTRSEAAAVISLNPDPLAFYVFTSSGVNEKYWIDQVPFGGGCVNNAALHLTNHGLPFGGRGASGIGRYHGRYSFDTFSHEKAVMRTPTWFDPALKYPPFKGKLNLFRRLIR